MDLPGVDPTFWDMVFNDGTAIGHGATSLGVGETSLVAAVLHGAIQDLYQRDVVKRKWAIWWLESNDPAYPHFSSHDCCEHLNINKSNLVLKLKKIGAIIDDGTTRPVWRLPAGKRSSYAKRQKINP